ncbi:MAG TPA: hypothetical protein VMH27_04870 [Puia sp.]|nr:hypothetical protein [Puia sp.]
MTRPFNQPIFLIFAVLISCWGGFSGCGYGIVGKKTVASVNQLSSTASGSVDKATKALDKTETDVLDALTRTRDTLFNFLRLNSTKEAHDISIGLLQGTIGYLDDEKNREALARLLETLINRAGGAAGQQLIAFKNQLLDRKFVGEMQAFLHVVMNELILHPADNLLTLVLSDRTREQLNKMLRMVIPAILNDSAIRQIGKLEDVLLGGRMKEKVAGLVDTALLVANHRLDSPIRYTINSIVEQNGGTIKKYAGSIIVGLIILAIIIGIVIYYVQHKKVVLHQQMLRKVALEIQKTKAAPAVDYETLTDNIQRAMEAGSLEKEMHRFLVEEGIKPAAPSPATS